MCRAPLKWKYIGNIYSACIIVKYIAQNTSGKCVGSASTSYRVAHQHTRHPWRCLVRTFGFSDISDDVTIGASETCMAYIGTPS